MNINDDVGLDQAAPVEQRDAPSLKEALEVYPNENLFLGNVNTFLVKTKN